MIRQVKADARAIRSEFGAFLRTRRERVRPEDVGLKRSTTRRTPGLRREEVAERAGFGVDWYIRLEQGRVSNPPQATIDALASALQLSAAEHEHLTRLGSHLQPATTGDVTVPVGLLSLIETLDRPAYATTRRGDVLAWNAIALEVFGAFDVMPIEDRNLVVYFFLNPYSRVLFGDTWPSEARRVLTQFRGTFDLSAGEPSFASLADRLRRESREFAQWWDTHDVASSGAGLKTLYHPKRGKLIFTYATFVPCDDVALKVSIFTPVYGSSSQRRGIAEY